MKAGRPIRFLAIAISGWTAGRAVMLWPVAHAVEAATRTIATPAAAMLVRVTAAEQSRTMRPQRAGRAARSPNFDDDPAPAVVELMTPVAVDEAPSPPEPRIIASFIPIPFDRSPRRFAASAWLIARAGQGGPTTGGQLGGAQMGVRGIFMLDRARRIALSARLSAPLAGKGREAAIGIDWQPLAAPVHLVAERRVALDGGRGGTALFAIGGVGPRQIAPRVRAEAYGQVGAIARDGIERFADGAARLSYDLGDVGGVAMDAGAGAWGGAQRGAARLDLGPSLGVRLPVAGQAIRLTLDWRQRIAGSARPGSGPALSIGSDF